MAQPTATLAYDHGDDLFTLSVVGGPGDEWTDMLWMMNKADQPVDAGDTDLAPHQGRRDVRDYLVAVKAATAPEVPLAPTNLTYVATSTTATISFTAGRDAGSPITNYEYKVGAGAWTALSPVDAASPVTITGLTPEATVSVLLRAVNAVGAGAQSAALSVTLTA